MTATTWKTALITGAANGLGWGLAQHFASLGYNLMLVDIDTTYLNIRQAELTSLYAQQTFVIQACDLTDDSTHQAILESLVTTFGRLDVLINNAGITHRSLANITGLSVTKKIMSLNFFTPVALTQLCLPLMVSSGVSHRPSTIINLGSMAGWLPVMARSSYCASKSALHQYFETFRAESNDLPIHILMVYPSFLDTDIEKNALSGDGKKAKHARSTVGSVNSIDWMVAKIGVAFNKQKPRLYPNRPINLVSIVYRLLPTLFLTMMRRKFASELNSGHPEQPSKNGLSK